MAARGQTWRDSEVDALIDVWSDETIQRLLGSSYRNEPIFRKIEEELRKRGIVRGWKQCRDKIKALRGKYKEIVDKLRRSGAGIDSDDEDLHVDWRYFWPMHRVMGSRPTAIPRHLLELGSEESPVMSESGREAENQQEEEEGIQQGENQEPIAVGESQQLSGESQQQPIVDEVAQLSPPAEQNQREATGEECQQAAEEENQPGPSRPKRRKLTKSDKAQKDISVMIEKITKQQEEMKSTIIELEDRRAESEAEQSRRELAREDRLLDLLGTIIMRNNGMMMPMSPSQLIPPTSHVPPSSSPLFNPYHAMYTFHSPGGGDDEATSGDDTQ